MIDGSLENLSPPSIKKIEVSFFPGCTGSFAETTDSVNTKIFKLVRCKDFFFVHIFSRDPTVLYPYCTRVIYVILLYCVCWCAPNLDDLEDYSEGDKSSRFATGISCTELHALAPRTCLDEGGLGLLQKALSGTRVRKRNRIFCFSF